MILKLENSMIVLANFGECFYVRYCKIRFQRLFTWVYILKKMIMDEEKLIIINPELPRKNDE